MAKDYRAYLVDRYGLDTSYNDGAGSLYLEFVGAKSLSAWLPAIKPFPPSDTLAGATER